MSQNRCFDVIVVGGGIAGSCLAGLLAQADLGVLVVEKEPQFRDRIRGEGTWPWGVAEALQAGLGEVLRQAEVVHIHALQRYEQRQPVETTEWSTISRDGVCEMTFSHTGLQEAALTWAAAQGAVALRPAKATRFAHNGHPTVTVAQGEEVVEYSARLVVGADGKRSGVRRWTGGETMADPEQQRFGGVLISGDTIDRTCDNYAWTPTVSVNWFAAGKHLTRIYLTMTGERLRESGADRSFDKLIAVATPFVPDGALTGAVQAGPSGFFPSNDVWASRIAGNDVVLIGDAAGAPDPTVGHGTPLLFHDVRLLRELLLSTRDWRAATAEFAERRARAFAVILEYDRWHTAFQGDDDAAARRRDGHDRAAQGDPSLGGFALLEAQGPHGLVADEQARRHFFGEDLP